MRVASTNPTAINGQKNLGAESVSEHQTSIENHRKAARRHEQAAKRHYDSADQQERNLELKTQMKNFMSAGRVK